MQFSVSSQTQPLPWDQLTSLDSQIEPDDWEILQQPVPQDPNALPDDPESEKRFVLQLRNGLCLRDILSAIESHLGASEIQGRAIEFWGGREQPTQRNKSIRRSTLIPCRQSGAGLPWLSAYEPMSTRVAVPGTRSNSSAVDAGSVVIKGKYLAEGGPQKHLVSYSSKPSPSQV